MTKDTFLNLPIEKQEKILASAKVEFAKNSIEEASIKNITDEADIARGSFYQYFDCKEDVLNYILKQYKVEINEVIETKVKGEDIDIFELFISMYDYIIRECILKDDQNFFKKIFENMKTSEDTLFSIMNCDYYINDFSSYYSHISKKNLDIKDEHDYSLIIRTLYAITKKSIVSFFQAVSEEEARNDFIRIIDIIKYGLVKSHK